MMQVSVRLVEFRGLVRDVVRSACRTALLDAGFTPDDYFYETMDTSAAGTTINQSINQSIKNCCCAVYAIDVKTFF